MAAAASPVVPRGGRGRSVVAASRWRCWREMRVRAECGASEGPRRHGRPALHEGPPPRSLRVPRRQDSAQRRAPSAQPGGGSGARPGGAEGAGPGDGFVYILL